MFPQIELSFFSNHFQLSTNLVLYFFAVVFAFVILSLGLRKEVPLWRVALLVLVPFIVGFLGARVFHVIWERPEYFISHPNEIFSRYDGRTFLGGFLLALPVFYFLNRWLILPSQRQKSFALAAIGLTFGYGLLRIGCFAHGCCWGTICKYPWAVRYFSEKSGMPYLGIPVHPVQLYDSFLSLLFFGFLVWMYFKSGKYWHYIPILFLIFHGFIRFFVEFFRGDTIRKGNVLFHLSTSQLISVGMICAGLVWIRFNKARVYV